MSSKYELEIDDLRTKKNRAELQRNVSSMINRNFNEIIEIKHNHQIIYILVIPLHSNRRMRRFYKKLQKRAGIAKTKIKRFGARVILVYTLVSPLTPIAAPIIQIGVSQVPISSVRPSLIKNEKFFKELNPRFMDVIEQKFDKIMLTPRQAEHADLIVNQLLDGSITIDQAILEMRGGDLNQVALKLLEYVLAYVIVKNTLDTPQAQKLIKGLKEYFGSEGFSPAQQKKDSGFRKRWGGGSDWGSPSPGDPSKWTPSAPSRYPSTQLAAMEKPQNMPQQTYSNLPTAQKSILTDPAGRDKFVEIDGMPRLDVLYGRVYEKCPAHGSLFNLEKKANGKVARSEQNVDIMGDELVKMAMSKTGDVNWYTEGGYQTGTPRGCDAVNVYDSENNILAIYRKLADGRNVLETVVEPTLNERKHFLATNGQFVTEFNLKDSNWQSSNPNWRNYDETKGQNQNPGLSPLSSTNLPSSTNPSDSSSGFTPISGTFETDIQGFTPTNSHTNNDS